MVFFCQLAYTILVISVHSLRTCVLGSLLPYLSTRLLYTVLHPLIALHPSPLPCTLYTVLYLLTLSCSPSTLLYSLTLSFMALHCPAFPYTVLHSLTLSCTPLHCPAPFTLFCISSHCPVSPYTLLYPLHYPVLLTLSCTPSHCPEFPYTALHPLHCSAPIYTPSLPCSLYSVTIPISMLHTLLCPPFFHSTSF